MFRFENELYLYGLLLIPLLYLVYWASMRWRNKAITELGDYALVQQLMPDFSTNKYRLKFVLYALAFAFICVGLANPQVGTKLEKVQRKGIDIFVALDVSKSMLAEDVKPTRLERAKQFVNRLITNMRDDRIGIIVFAGNAYLQMPLTIDYAAAKLFLQTISPDIVPTQGTALGDAIELSMASYDEEQLNHKALVLISDGENHEEGAVEMAERAKEEGIIIHAMGVGSDEGAPIPTYTKNGKKGGNKRDNQNRVIISKLDQAMLQELAQIGSGKYFQLRGARNEINEILDELDNIEKKDFEDRVFTDYADQFQYFIAIALLLLLAEFVVSQRKRGWLNVLYQKMG